MLYIYYSNEEYEPNKHRILTTYSDRSVGASPEETSSSLSNYTVIEVDERYNPKWNILYESANKRDFLELPDEFYINNAGQIVNNDTGQVVNVNPNPQKEAYKLSQLYGLTHEQLDTLVDELSTMADYKEAFRKALHVILWLVKQTKLDK